MHSRADRFLHVARRLIFDTPSSPYLALLRHAGVEAGDLEREVRDYGLEGALVRLRDAGVYLTHREFRGLDPIRRPGLTLDVQPGHFTNPSLTSGVSGTSSGSRSSGTSIDYSWPFLLEETADERLLFEQHGLDEAALAMWLPVLPGIAGLHNLLLHINAGPAVREWFSQAPIPAWRTSGVHRGILELAARCAARDGGPRCHLSQVPLGEARRVAEWLAAPAVERPRALKTYASSAVRVAAAARDAGLDVRGRVIFTGGEPLTVRRRRFIESTGLVVHPRYATTEAGMVGSACGRLPGDAPDAMHVYLDRLAVVAGAGEAWHDGHLLHRLAFTSLSLHSPRVLLNTDLGDWGLLGHHACDCRFGQAGMHVAVSRITSPEKLTGEGMSLLSSDVDNIVGALIERAGGSPDDYQFEESHDEQGFAVLTIAVHPDLHAIDDAAFTGEVISALRARPGGGELAAMVWRDAGSLRVVRRVPQMTGGHKKLSMTSRPHA